MEGEIKVGYPQVPSRFSIGKGVLLNTGQACIILDLNVEGEDVAFALPLHSAREIGQALMEILDEG